MAGSQKARLTGFVLIFGLLLSLYLRYYIYPYRGRGLTGLPAKKIKLQACQKTFNGIPVFNENNELNSCRMIKCILLLELKIIVVKEI